MPLPERLHLANLPTPIETLPTLSKELGVDLRVKRDDLTGSWLTGNKIRKLEYLAPEARRLGCDTLVTIGAVDSNHCRATAIVAAKVGMKCHLILRGQEPESLRGNLLLDRMVGAETTFVEERHFRSNREAVVQEVVGQITARGSKAYVIPVGGSNEVGALGYIEAVDEIRRDGERTGWLPDQIVNAVGSGGTFAGLLLGVWMHKLDTRVFGVNVCESAQEFQEKALEDCTLANERYQLGLDILENDIFCQDGYVGVGYAQTTDEQLRFYAEVARKEALLLEPVYTGKAFWGMVHEIQKGTVPAGSKVLFLHTGGVFGLEAYGARIGEIIDRAT